MSMTIVGNHPYADKYPMLGDAELAELAESIRENGLRQPIVLTPDGLILDGRNRAKACEIAGVEPTFTTYEGDDLAEYVIDCNSSRRHMSTGARAMATALVLDADGRRGNGRWKRGSVDIGDSSNIEAWRKAINTAGLILDHAPALAQEVVDGNMALDAAYRKACEARDAERNKLAERERIAAEESDARKFVEHNDPDLASQVGEVFQSYAEAQAVWEKRNREEATRIRREKAAKAAAEKAERDNAEQAVREVLGALIRLESLAEPDKRSYTRDCMSKHLDAAPPTQRHMAEPHAIRAVSDSLTAYANEMETN